MNGSGSIANGDSVTANVGSAGTTANTNGTGMAYVTGKLNQGVTFDGVDDYINLGTSIGPSTGSFTISFWQKSAPNGAGFWSFASNRTVTGNNPGILIIQRFDGGAAVGKLRLQLNSSAAVTRYNIGTINVSDGVWHHVAIAVDRTSNKMNWYVDGISDVSNVDISGLGDLSSSHAFELGRDEAYVNNSGSRFNGSFDDFSIWNAALTSSQIQTIYSRQSVKYSGQLTSRVLDAFSSQSWTTLASTTTLPFYKELPGSAGSESSSTGYSSSGGGLMTGLVGLWRLNEAAGTSGANSVVDSSGQGNHGTPTSTTFGTTGQLYTAANFNGSSSFISNSWGLLTGNASRSISVWFNTTSVADSNWISWGVSGSNQLSQVGIYQGKIGYLGYANDLSISVTTSNYADGKWHHLLIAFDGTNRTLFLDGKSVASDTTSLTTGTSAINIGRAITGSYYYSGQLDEVAIWSRGLSAAEVKEVYRRGANRVKYQLRSCANSDCSDQEALTSNYKGWKGPDNTGLSYFSELYNTTSNVLAGTVSTGTPTMTFSNFSGSGLSVTSNRYFQYRAILESDDQNTLCNYGSGAVPCSPELQSVAVGPNHYDTTVQSIISKASIGSAYQTLDVNGLTETLGANTCSSGAKYSASSDGTTFYYWNSGAWGTSSDYTTANDAATMRTNISSFPSSAAGTGTLQIKTYLKSSGTSACEVDNLQFTGKKY